jgi:hypothetical protein
MDTLVPYTMDELVDRYEDRFERGIASHLLIIYSAACGLRAKTIVDIGLGSTTRTLRAAAVKTGGVVYSCDRDRERYEHLLHEQDRHWNLFIGSSERFIDTVPAPIDFAVHDGAHDFFQVRQDLERLLPRMRTLSLLMIHDVQHERLGHGMMSAIREAIKGYKVTFTALPWGSGLLVLRIEQSQYPPASEWGVLTQPFPLDVQDRSKIDRTAMRWMRWRLGKIIRRR